jgi:hypothetical protein
MFKTKRMEVLILDLKGQQWLYSHRSSVHTSNFRFLANDQQILIHFRRYLDSILVSLQQQRQLQMQDYYSLHMAFHSKRDLVTSRRNQLEETQH